MFFVEDIIYNYFRVGEIKRLTLGVKQTTGVVLTVPFIMLFCIHSIISCYDIQLY